MSERGSDAGRALRRHRPRAVVVGERPPGARAHEARAPPPSVSRQVHPAARGDPPRAVRPAGRAGARPVRRLGHDARPVAGVRPRRRGRRHRRVQLSARARQDRRVQPVHAGAGHPRRPEPRRHCRRALGVRSRLVRAAIRGGPARVPLADPGLRARRRPAHRAGPGGPLGAADDPFRSRLRARRSSSRTGASSTSASAGPWSERGTSWSGTRWTRSRGSASSPACGRGGARRRSCTATLASSTSEAPSTRSSPRRRIRGSSTTTSSIAMPTSCSDSTTCAISSWARQSAGRRVARSPPTRTESPPCSKTPGRSCARARPS